MRAVAFTDVLQGAVLFIGSVVFLIIQRTELGGMHTAYNYWSNPMLIPSLNATVPAQKALAARVAWLQTIPPKEDIVNYFDFVAKVGTHARSSLCVCVCVCTCVCARVYLCVHAWARARTHAHMFGGRGHAHRRAVGCAALPVWESLRSLRRRSPCMPEKEVALHARSASSWRTSCLGRAFVVIHMFVCLPTACLFMQTTLAATMFPHLTARLFAAKSSATMRRGVATINFSFFLVQLSSMITGARARGVGRRCTPAACAHWRQGHAGCIELACAHAVL